MSLFTLVWKQKIVRYVISGGLGATTDLGSLYVLTSVLHVWYVVSTVIAFMIAFCVGFSLQKYWTFTDADKNDVHKQVSLYLLVTFCNLIINTYAVYFLVDFVYLHYMAAQVVAAGGLALVSYFIYEKYVFKVDSCKKAGPRILVCTQKVDKNDPILGFFHGWLMSLRKKSDALNVICLQKGEHDLPEDTSVLSLGKECGTSFLKKIFLFYIYIWKMRTSYDTVFIHMNFEYVLMGTFFWKIYGKKVIFWYNHPQGNWKTILAAHCSDTVLFTSAQSFFGKRSIEMKANKKYVQMPVGVDTDEFTFGTMAKNGLVSFLYVGRFSPVKHVDSIVLAFVAYSKASKVSINLDIYAASLGRDAEYEKLVREKAGIAPSIHFQGAARYEALPQIYRTHDVLLNATESGSFDKVLFEAMASGCLVVASNGGYRDMVPEKYRTALCPKDTTAPAFESSLKALVDISAEDRELFRKKMREIVVQKHSLECLITKIVEFSK